MGIAHYYLSDYNKAIPIFQNALDKAEKQKIPDIILSSSLHLANSYLALNVWDSAYEIFLSTVTFIEEYKKVEYYPSIYEGLGNIDFSWGKYDSAEEYFNLALNYSEELNYEENIVFEKMTLSRILYAKNELDRAVELLDGLLQRQGIEKSRYYGQVFNSLGIVYLKKLEIDTAMENFNQALAIAESQNNTLELIQIYIHMGGAYQLLEDYDKAIEYYETALPMAFENQRIDDGTRALLNLGISYTALEDYDSAIDYFLQTIELKEQLRLSVVGDSRRDYLAAELRAYQWLAIVYLHQEDFENAVNTMELASGKYLREQMEDKGDKLSFSGVSNYRRHLDDNQTIVKLGSVNIPWQSLISINKDDTNGLFLFHDEILDKLPRTLLANFHKLEENHRGLSAVKAEENIIPFDEMTVEDLIRYYRLLLSAKGNESQIREIGRLLYNYLLSPIEEDFIGKDELVIVPEGILAFIPFETLVMADGRYLIEEYVISYAQSLAVMEIISGREYDDKRQDFFGIGGADYENPNENLADSLYSNIIVDQWNNLPGTLDELENIGKEFNNPLILTESDASETEIKALSDANLLKNYKILHFATHGFVLPENPDLSAIVLAQNDSGNNDGYLNVLEISELKIEADFVNLSACETGLGKIYGGEGVVGLAQAFLIAGANSLSVSLWQVADESTRDFMSSFYSFVKRDDMSFKNAMAEMKRVFINSERYSHPYYWAPFVFYGR